MKKETKTNRKIRNLVIIFALTAVVISVSTYAWFVGLRTVNVSSFDVKIAAVDQLSLSLTGTNFGDSVTINASNFSTTYTNNTNIWGGTAKGLIPISTVGDIDSTVGRLKLFEKASYTATAGGYRLMASQVKNNGATEQRGYVAFDLFIRNLTGTQYIDTYDEKDEEAIYLTVDSEATVSLSEAGGVDKTGIENSIRVAFAQIGRVKGDTTDQETITGIGCNTDTNVTGICTRTAQIWEPNDTDHEKNAINWYEESCLARKTTGTDITKADSYAGECGEVIDGLAYPTYAINKAITSAMGVDIYDGEAYNGYETSSQLTAFPYFTDTDKLKTGTNRPTFMKLAPSSITKVRIYIYIEGQDIDNYDFSSIGKSISIKFGFTKERFNEDDIDYTGPDVNQGDGPDADDKTAPIITLLGDSPMEITKGSTFVDPGATAKDNKDGTIAADKIKATGTVNINVIGEYKITYTVSDTAGNVATKTRTVTVKAAG